jgi:hypothetical protein
MSKKIGSRGPLYFPKRRGMAWVGMADLSFSYNPGLAKEEPSCSPTLRRSNLCGTRCSKEGFCMIELPEELLCNQRDQWGGGIGEIKKGNRSLAFVWACRKLPMSQSCTTDPLRRWWTKKETGDASCHRDILVERYLTFKMTDVALGTNERRPHSVPVAYRAAWLGIVHSWRTHSCIGKSIL